MQGKLFSSGVGEGSNSLTRGPNFSLPAKELHGEGELMAGEERSCRVTLTGQGDRFSGIPTLFFS
jgi:hypothetical protein